MSTAKKRPRVTDQPSVSMQKYINDMRDATQEISQLQERLDAASVYTNRVRNDMRDATQEISQLQERLDDTNRVLAEVLAERNAERATVAS